MTENDIIKSLEACSSGCKCDLCCFKGAQYCDDELMKNAIHVIKHLRAEIEAGNKTVEQMDANIKILNTACKFQFDKADLIKRVNEIIEEAVAHGGDIGGSYNSNWRGIIEAMELFLGKYDKENQLLIVVDGGVPKFREK